MDISIHMNMGKSSPNIRDTYENSNFNLCLSNNINMQYFNSVLKLVSVFKNYRLIIIIIIRFVKRQNVRLH